MLMAQLILIQVVTFIALVLVLKKLLYSETGKALKRLQWLNHENEAKADELRKKSEEADREYQEKLRKAEEEITKLKVIAKTEAERLKTKVVEEAKKESEKIIAQAQKTKEDMRSEIAVEMEAKAVDFACELLLEIFDAEVIKNIHNILISEMILGMENLDFGRGEEGAGVVEVFSPYPLGSNEKRKMEEILSLKVKRKISIAEKIDEKLIAGIIIKIGNLALDGSVSNKLEEARQKLNRSIG